MAKVVLISPFDEWCFGLRQLQALLKHSGHSTDLVFLRAMEDINVPVANIEDGGFHFPPASVTKRELDLLTEFLVRQQPLVVGPAFRIPEYAFIIRVDTPLRPAEHPEREIR